MIIEVCSNGPHAVACTDEGYSIMGSTYESEILDCTKGGDVEGACLYILSAFNPDFRVIAKDSSGSYVNRPATDEELQLTCEAMYFDSEADFSDVETAKMYLVWEAASAVESEDR
tara:strand:+ start:43 stop:387 length:345 start_codon:yes stop_codon:yes gene_type:complete